MTLIDTWDPAKVTETQITINMLHNVYPPQFNQTTYTASIYENAVIGTSIITLNATDADGVIPICLIISGVHLH